jgi:hypothetical protein
MCKNQTRSSYLSIIGTAIAQCCAGTHYNSQRKTVSLLIKYPFLLVAFGAHLVDVISSPFRVIRAIGCFPGLKPAVETLGFVHNFWAGNKSIAPWCE